MSVQRQFMKTVTALFFGMIGSGVLNFGISLYVLRTTGSSLSFAMTMIIAPLVQILLTPLVGHVVDRYDRQRIIGSVQVASVLTLVVFALLFQRVNNILYLVLPVLIVLRVADMFFGSAYSSAMRNIVTDDLITRLQSFLSGFQSIAGILSPILGAALYALLSMPVYIGLVAVFELLALLINLTIDFQFNPSEERSEPVQEGVWASFLQGFEYVKTRPDLIRMGLCATIINLFFMGKAVGQPLLIINHFGMSDTQFGLIQMMASVGMFVLSLIYGIKQYEAKKPLNLLYLVGIILGGIVALSALPGLLHFPAEISFYYFLILSLLAGGTSAMVNIPMMTFMQKQIPDEYKGRAFTLFGTLATGLMPIGILFFGWLYEYIAVSPVFLVVGFLIIAIMSYMKLKTPPHLMREEHYDVLNQSSQNEAL